MNVYTVTHAVMCPGSWKSGCALLFHVSFCRHTTISSLSGVSCSIILLGCVYTLNIHDIHECSVVCTYMCWCTHTCNGAHTTAHKQHTPCREEPFFMAGVVETTGTGRNNPCSASTTLLIIFSSPTFRTCPCRAFRVAIGYMNSTPSTQTRANTTTYISYYSHGGKNNAKTIVWNIRGHLMLECFSLCNLWPVCPMVVAGSNHFVKTIDAQHQ
jgi:hypothetical protein